MRIHANTVPTDKVERREVDGTEYLVAPVTFIKSMNLHRGYVPKRQVEKATDRWEETPVIPEHPTNENGKPVSINDESSDKTPYGVIRNTETEVNGDAKTNGELWINVEKAESIGGEAEATKDDLDSGRAIKVSSAYGGVRLPSGEYDGEQRDKVVGNLRPDHVATIRNGKARCSPRDGCLAGPNAISANSNIGVMVNGITDDSVSPKDGQDEGTGDMTESYNALFEARRPEYDGTTTDDWSSPTFSEYVEALGFEADNVEDLNVSQKRQIAEMTLLGEPDADTLEELRVFPVVEPDSRNLSENALIAVLGGRGAQADIPENVLESARSTTRSLLEEEFERDLSANAGFLAKIARILGFNGELSGNEPAESGVEDDNTMNERTEELVELGFNSDNLPEEDTECFDRIYDEFAGNDEPEDEPDEDEETADNEEPEESEPAVTFETEEEFEAAVADVASEAVDEALAANQKRQEKTELADDIIANSDDYDADDRETLLESPKSVLKSLKDEVSAPEPTPDYGASRGVTSSNSSESSDGMPALSASERIAEIEGDD